MPVVGGRGTHLVRKSVLRHMKLIVALQTLILSYAISPCPCKTLVMSKSLLNFEEPSIAENLIFVRRFWE